MENQEQTIEQVRAEVHKANAVIRKLQTEIGNVRGALALVEVERDAAYEYIAQLGNQANVEEEEEAPKKAKKKK